jgi:hypothetical protein
LWWLLGFWKICSSLGRRLPPNKKIQFLNN